MAPLHASLSLTTWTWEPTVLAGMLALTGGYVWLLRRAWSPLARIYFAAGLLVMFLALASPIDTGGDHYLFSLHMLQHLLLAMIVPPLLILGLPESWRGFDRVAVPPLTTNIAFNLVLAIWHLPFLYGATLRIEPLHVLEHLSFLAAGALFWWPILVPAGRPHSMSVIGKIAYLGFAGVPPTILGLAFILSPNVIYPFYAAAPRVTPLSPLDDQVWAGLVMFGLGNLIYFVAIWIIFFSLDDKRATAGISPVPDPLPDPPPPAGEGAGLPRAGEGTGLPRAGEGAGLPRAGEGTGLPRAGEGTGLPRAGEGIGSARVGQR